MRIVGLDMSITCSGVAIYEGKLTVTTIPTKPKEDEHDILRYTRIVKTLLSHLGDASQSTGTLVFIEQYAYAANGQITRIAELGGILRYMLFTQANLPINRFFEVSPSTLKKFILGSGKAPKEQIIKEVFKRYEYDASDNNEADAVCLAMLGKALCDHLEGIPKWQRESALAVLKTNHMALEDFYNVAVCQPATTRGKVPRTTPKRAPATPQTTQATNSPRRAPKASTASNTARDASSIDFFSRRVPKA